MPPAPAESEWYRRCKVIKRGEAPGLFLCLKPGIPLSAGNAASPCRGVSVIGECYQSMCQVKGGRL